MTSIETLRAVLDIQREQLTRDLAARDQAQLSLADAQEDLGIKEHRVDARYREINYLQGQIDELEAEQAPIPGPDQPTNIPDHAVPWTPIEPAVGEE